VRALIYCGCARVCTLPPRRVVTRAERKSRELARETAFRNGGRWTKEAPLYTMAAVLVPTEHIFVMLNEKDALCPPPQRLFSSLVFATVAATALWSERHTCPRTD